MRRMHRGTAGPGYWVLELSRVGRAVVVMAGIGAGILGASGAVAGAAVPGIAFVAPTGAPSNADVSCGSAAYARVQTAVDAVGTGGTVHVCAGTYRTTVSVTASDLAIEGSGSASIIAPTTVTCRIVATSFTGEHSWAPVVDVQGGASAVTIAGLRIDGDAVTSYTGQGATECGLVGLLFDSASGSVSDASVLAMAGPHHAGKYVGIGVVQGTASITGSQVSGYQSNGVICDTGSECTITEDTVTGTGEQAAFAQSGIQVGGDSTGSVSRDTVDDNSYAEATAEGIGILVLQSSGVTVSENALRDDQAAMVVGTFGYSDGAAMATDLITGNTVSYDGAFSGFGTTIAGLYLFADAPGSVAATVQDNAIEGPGTRHSSVAGLQIGTQYSYGAYRTRFRYGQVTVTATRNRITGWHTDVLAAGAMVTAQVHDNDLLGNEPVSGLANWSRTVGVGTTAISVVNAADNWWGCTRGPNAAGCTTTTGSVTYSPWLTSAARTVPPGSGGYWLVSSGGGISSFGTHSTHGSMGGTHLNSPIVGIAADPVTGGYWMVASDGGVFTFTAPFEGSMGGQHLNAPVVGMAADPTGHGYWLVSADGGIFTFGTAAFHGSMGGRHLSAPVVGIAADPATGGYWLVSANGAVYSFTAPFEGSMVAQHLSAPAVGMAAAPTGNGYWIVASDGGIFTFGTAGFRGSMGGSHLTAPIVGMTTDPATSGYWLVSANGAVYGFTAPFEGSMAGPQLSGPIVAMTS